MNVCVRSQIYDTIDGILQRNERREREQREMAKRLAASGIGSEDGSSRVSGSHSISDSDTYTQV